MESSAGFNKLNLFVPFEVVDQLRNVCLPLKIPKSCKNASGVLEVSGSKEILSELREGRVERPLVLNELPLWFRIGR
jgi:hypothetical protein